MPNISETLKTASEILHQSEIIEPRREANSLLAFALQKDKTFLIAHPEYMLTEEEEIRFRDFLQRRARHEPFQYIRGSQEFFGLNFMLTPDVLIPRPETELIVEAAIEILKEKENPQFCEIGIGSGCISISILHEIKNASATGLDISESALKIAQINAESNEVSNRIELKISDVFEMFTKESDDKMPSGQPPRWRRYEAFFDLIVSNPPYVPDKDFAALQAEVREFEPRIALTDGKDGLSIIEKIIREAPNFLKPNCFLLMEIGFNQSNRVREMFDWSIWQAIEFLPDLQGIPRMLKARIKAGL